MYKSKVLISFVLIFYLLFAVFEFSGYEIMAYYFNSLIAPLITVLYIVFIERKSKLFLMFLICYSFPDILGLVIRNMPHDESLKLYDFQYYLGNALYILAYLLLSIKIIKSLNFKQILKYFKTHVIVLSLLNIYLLFVLHTIINPNLVRASDYYLELSSLCLDKTLTKIFLKKSLNINIPKTYKKFDNINYPVIVKQNTDGSSNRDLIVNNKKQLFEIINDNIDFMLITFF